jgi:hypothetical protein
MELKMMSMATKRSSLTSFEVLFERAVALFMCAFSLGIFSPLCLVGAIVNLSCVGIASA